MPGILKSKLFQAFVIAAALVGLYAFLGFQVAPGIVRDQAIGFVRETYGRELRIGEVRIHPFRLQVEVQDLVFPDADGAPMLGFRRLFADFEVASLWQRAWVFREVRLEAPDLHAVVHRDGSLNLADLAVNDPAAPPGPAPLPAVWLQSFEVVEGAVRFQDFARARPVDRRLAPVDFALKDFRTTPAGGDFHLAASGDPGESFEWKGQFALAPVVASRGEFSVRGLRAPGAAEFLGDERPFRLTSGVINLAGTYQVTLGKTLDLDLRLPKVALTGLSLRARGADADWVQVPELLLADTAVALPGQTVTIAEIALTGLKAQAWLATDGSINLASLVAPAGAPPDAALSKPAVPARPWEVKVASIRLSDAAVDFEDRTAEPAKQFVIAPLDVRISNASLDLARPLPVSVDAVVNGHASLKVAGTVTPEPFAADLDLALSRARMQILQPYVLPLADLTIKGGLLAVDGKLRIDPPAAPGPDLSFAGQVAITDFKSVDNALGQDLVNFRSVELRKLRYDLAPDAVSIDLVRVQQPFARVIISSERVVNIAAVLDPKGTAAALAARRAGAAAGEPAPEGRKKTVAAKAPAPAPLPVETTPIRIREVQIDGGTLDFSDFFVQPNFSARVQKLGGTLTGLSSNPTAHATVNLAGAVDEFSPVSITGKVQPFAFERYTDISLRFENISLPIFNPYSGQFAGYNIAKGKLTTDLHYLVQDRKLDAQHKIRIDQLEWGDESATRGEATLPVKFATALLRDRDGVINLDVPVTGTLDDPSFRIGPIIWQIIKNLLVKAVTAPFALLGALFEGAEDAQFVDFAPGSADLDAATTERLGALSRSLVEKPGIKLDVPIGTLAELDGPALAERAYQAQLAAAVAATLGKGSKEGAPSPSFAALEPDQQIDVLTALVKDRTGSEPGIPAPPSPPEGTSSGDARALARTAAVDYLQKEARAQFTVPDADLARLGEERAAAVQRALLTGSDLEPTRVFLTKAGKVTPQDGKVRLELGLQ